MKSAFPIGVQITAPSDLGKAEKASAGGQRYCPGGRYETCYFRHISFTICLRLRQVAVNCGTFAALLLRGGNVQGRRAGAADSGVKVTVKIPKGQNQGYIPLWPSFFPGKSRNRPLF